MKRKTISVLKTTYLKDLKKGDLVMTAEIHKVVEIKGKEHISVITQNPPCEYCIKNKRLCRHERIMNIGYGQHGILKIINEK